MQDLNDGRDLNCRPLEQELTTLPTVQKVLPPNYLPVSLSVRLLVSSIISLLFEFLCFLLVLWSLYMFICLFHCLSSLCFFHFDRWICMFLTHTVISLYVFLLSFFSISHSFIHSRTFLLFQFSLFHIPLILKVVASSSSSWDSSLAICANVDLRRRMSLHYCTL